MNSKSGIKIIEWLLIRHPLAIISISMLAPVVRAAPNCPSAPIGMWIPPRDGCATAPCTNGPANASYTSGGGRSNSCLWACDAGTFGGVSILVTDHWSCLLRRINMGTSAVSTMAGESGKADSLDGVGSAAHFTYPSGVAVSPDFVHAYVAEWESHVVRRVVIESGVVTTLAGTARRAGFQDGPGSLALFNTPTDIGVSPDGTFIVVSDSANHVLRRIDLASGNVTLLAGKAGSLGHVDGDASSARFNNPGGCKVSLDGSFALVADLKNQAIRRVDLRDGRVTTVAGSPGSVGYQDGVGAAAHFISPTGLAISPDGSFAVVSDSFFYLRRVDVQTGAVSIVAGSQDTEGVKDGVGTLASFGYPLGMSISPDGAYAVVADSYGQVIRLVALDSGTVSTLAGLPANSGDQDGTGSNARFWYPGGAAIDPRTTQACAPCTNPKPARSRYSEVGALSRNCPWECEAGFFTDGESCHPCTQCGKYSTACMTSFDAQCHPCPDRACAVVDAAFHFMEFSSPRGFEIGVGQALKAAVASSIGSGTRASDVVLFDVCLGSKCDLSSALAARGLRKAGERNVSVTARIFTSADPFAIRSRMGGADFLTAVRQSISTLTSGKQILPTIGSLAVSMCKEGMFISNGECRACTQCPGGLLKNCAASEDAICNQDSVSMNAIIAAAVVVGSVVALALALLAYFVGRRFRMVAARRKFMQAVQEAEVGVPPTDQIIHYELKGEFHAEEVLGRGGLGIVVRAQRKSGGKSVAIKMVLPSAVVFTEHEERQLIREAKILERISSEHVVQLVGAWGMSKAKDCFWFVMEHLDGEDLRRILKREGPFTDLECIKVARSVLAALKPLHADGCIHRDIKPGNIMRCHPASSCKSTACGEGSSVVYKLIDFGVSVAIKEDHGGEAASTSFLTLDGHARPASGTLMYMSPEMFRDPAKAGYATDIWSLGVTLFELATGGLPFPLREGRSWFESIAEDLDAAAPDVMDRISADRRPTFDHNLARVIARALEKRAADRFGSADEMHEATYRCLVQRGEACYSGFISYRVASEAPVARILFDVLNHTVTPGGHRVTLFWDRHRLVAGDDWEAGFSSGLLNSLCFFSLLSYGSTAPLAALPEGDDERRALLAQGWEERPVGRERLRGGDTDPEDNFLKECMLACALLERMEAVQNEPSLRGPKEVGRLQLAYPILIGRQHPLGHADHPGMGSFFEVQGGGGRYPERPSPRTSQAVTRFLRDSAGAPREVELAAAQKSVASTLRSLTKLQGCQMWDHPRTLASPDHLGSTAVALSQEQQDLVGAGLAGSLLGLGCAMPAEGFSEVQLRMIKAQILYRLPKFHEVIDRAVSLHNGLNQRSGGTKCYEGTFANRASVATVQRRERGSEERIKIDISPRPSREDPEGLRLGVGSEYAGRRSEHGRSESQHADLGFYSLNPSTPPNVGT